MIIIILFFHYSLIYSLLLYFQSDWTNWFFYHVCMFEIFCNKMLEETRLDNENSSNMKPDWIQVLLEPETKLIRKKILETGNALEAENIIEANRLIEELKDIKEISQKVEKNKKWKIKNQNENKIRILI